MCLGVCWSVCCLARFPAVGEIRSKGPHIQHGFSQIQICSMCIVDIGHDNGMSTVHLRGTSRRHSNRYLELLTSSTWNENIRRVLHAGMHAQLNPSLYCSEQLQQSTHPTTYTDRQHNRKYFCLLKKRRMQRVFYLYSIHKTYANKHGVGSGLGRYMSIHHSNITIRYIHGLQ